MFYRKRRYQRKGKRAVRRTARKPKVSLPVKRYVRNAIHRNDENKVLVDFYLNNTITTAASSYPTSINLCPVMSQGTSQSTRIGNKIKIRRSYVKGYVNLLPYNATNNPQVGPQMVKIWVCSYKTFNTTAISATNADSKFFETGSSSSGMVGNILDLLLPTNNDSWKVHYSKTFEIGTTASTFGGTTVNAYIANDNSKMIMPFYFNLTKCMKKTISYNDNVNTPTNTNCFLVFQSVYADGTSTLVTGSEFHAVVRTEFEDA